MKKKISIKSFFSLSSVFVAVLGLLICLGFKFLVFDSIYQSALSEANNTVISLKSNFEQVFLSNKRTAELISYSSVVQEYLSVENTVQRYYLNQEINELLEVICKQDSEIAQISVKMVDGSDKMLYENFSIDYNVKRWALEQKKPGVSIMNAGAKSFPRYYCFTQNIINTQIGEHYGEPIATLFIIYRSNVFHSMLEPLQYNDENFLVVVDKESQIVLSVDSEIIGTVIDISENYQSQEIGGTDFRIVNGRIINAAVEDLEYLFTFAVMIFFLLFALQLLQYLLLNYKLLRPLRRLSAKIASVDYKNLDGTFHSENIMELECIVTALNQMMRRIKDMSKRIVSNQQKLYEMELLKQKSMLNALLSQINPHFLYNCFECINGIAAEYRCPEIVTISTALAKMFRYNIREKTYVFLWQEIEIVEEYTAVMKIKFPDKFTVYYDFEEELMNKKVVKMLLQPVVENAFKHGLTAIEGCGELKISGKITGNHFEFVIEDNGIGIEKEKLKNLQNQLKNNDEKTSGIGLSNINQRIKLCYGAEYGLQIESRAPQGTIVKIILPDSSDMSFE